MLFLIGKIKAFNKRGFQYLVLCLVGALGLYGQQNRFEQMIDPFKGFVIPEDISFAIAPYADGFKNLLNIEVRPTNSFTIEDSNKAKILYLSQTINFDEWISQEGFTESQINSIVNIEVVKNIPGKNSFIPYIPEGLNNEGFAHDRRNGLYVTTFQIASLTESKK